LTPQLKGERSEINYFTGLSQEEIQKERDEILSTNAKSIQALASMARDVLKNDFICVLGSEGKIKQSQDLFKNLVSVFE